MLNIQKEKSEIASLMFKHVIGSRSVPGWGGGGTTTLPAHCLSVHSPSLMCILPKVCVQRSLSQEFLFMCSLVQGAAAPAMT